MYDTGCQAIARGGATCVDRVWPMLRVWPTEGGNSSRLGEGWCAYGPEWAGYGRVWGGYGPGGQLLDREGGRGWDGYGPECCGYGLGRAGLTQGWVRLA